MKIESDKILGTRYWAELDNRMPLSYYHRNKSSPGAGRGSATVFSSPGPARRARKGRDEENFDYNTGPGNGRPGRRPGLPRTGQTFSYHDYDDGYYLEGADFAYQTLDPAANGEIVAVDNVTGLMWAADGEEAGCNFGAQTTWEEALDWAVGLTFAGYSDWQLPNLRQLESLVDAGRDNPAIDETYFPLTRVDHYWTGTTFNNQTGNAWTVSFFMGDNIGRAKVNLSYVRPVRTIESLPGD